MPLGNYFIPVPEVPERVHFYDHHIDIKTITDRDTGNPTTRNALVFEVDRLNGKEVQAQYSVLAEKHYAQFEPYLKDKSYRDNEFQITVHGEGFRRSWTVLVIPIK